MTDLGAALGTDRQSRPVWRHFDDDGLVQERRVRFQAALAECARSLLASTGQDRLERALEALLEATEATYVFVERNVMHPDLGFCSQFVIEVAKPMGHDPEVHNEYWDLVPWDRMPITRSHLERGDSFVVIPEELEGVEYDLYAADPHPVKSELNIPINVDGEWAGLIGFAEDESSTRWSDEDVSLLQTAAGMIAAFWERETSGARLQELVRSKDDFIAAVSHELRTPLTAIFGLANELAAGTEDFTAAEIQELTDTIAAQSSDMTYLIDDLLVAARTDAGRVNVRCLPVDLRTELREVARVLQVGVDANGLDDGAVIVWADSRRVRQILRNLLTNAQRHGGRRVVASIESCKEHVELTVRDDGPGIAADRRAQIFEPYSSGHDRSGLTQSIGIGLTVSRQLARLMKGDLIYRFDDGWSAFTLTLPNVKPRLSVDGGRPTDVHNSI